jgi:hypothetical protein
MDAKLAFQHLAAARGTFEVATRRAGTIRVVETTIDVRGAVVSERPGEGSFVELEGGFPVMAATANVAAAFARHAETAEFACALMSFEDDGIRLVAISDNSHVYMDGDETILDDDALPMAA